MLVVLSVSPVGCVDSVILDGVPSPDVLPRPFLLVLVEPGTPREDVAVWESTIRPYNAGSMGLVARPRGWLSLAVLIPIFAGTSVLSLRRSLYVVILTSLPPVEDILGDWVLSFFRGSQQCIPTFLGGRADLFHCFVKIV